MKALNVSTMSLSSIVVQKWNPVSLFAVGSCSKMAVQSESGRIEGICLKGGRGVAVVCWIVPCPAIPVPLVDGSMLSSSLSLSWLGALNDSVWGYTESHVQASSNWNDNASSSSKTWKFLVGLIASYL